MFISIVLAEAPVFFLSLLQKQIFFPVALQSFQFFQTSAEVFTTLRSKHAADDKLNTCAQRGGVSRALIHPHAAHKKDHLHTNKSRNFTVKYDVYCCLKGFISHSVLTANANHLVWFNKINFS